MITPAEAQNRSPNCTSTRSGRAACPAFSIISAVGFLDFATSTIASCARPNASSTLPAAFAARPDVASVPVTGTVSTSISISPTPTAISRPAATTPHPPPCPEPASVARQACARPNASSTFPAAFAARPDVGSVPATGTASTSISISPTLTGISRPAATTPHPLRPPRNGSTAWPAISSQGMTIALPIPPRHRMATMQFVRLAWESGWAGILRRGGPAILTDSDSDAPPDAGLPVRYAQGTRARPS